MTPAQQQQKADTLQKCRDLCRLQHKSYKTEDKYLHYIGRFIDWLAKHGRGLPDSRSRMEAFLTAMAHRKASVSGQNGAFNALLFLYKQVRREEIGDVNALRAKRPQRCRQALPKDVTLALLDRIKDRGGYPTKFVCRLLYGLGLRVTEPLNLRIKDIDVEHSQILIIGAKGGKDRWLNVPCGLMAGIVAQMKQSRRVWEHDRDNGIPVQLPGQLALKYPRAPFAWQWAWVFPMHNPCVDRRSGKTVRWRMMEDMVQRACYEAATAMDLQGRASPHVFRHCFATHVFEARANPRDVQVHLGHSQLETTMTYVRPQPSAVISPLA